jgi:predicted nucleic acid-binding protein
MSVLVDTNILLRRVQPSHPSHLHAAESVAMLLAIGESVCFTQQNIVEFWNVATRPHDKNGLGFPLSLVIQAVSEVERLLTFLPDSAAVYTEWKRLVIAHRVSGVRVHDAKLVAAMKVHRVEQILTFNADDFARYSGIQVMHPRGLLNR